MGVPARTCTCTCTSFTGLLIHVCVGGDGKFKFHAAARWTLHFIYIENPGSFSSIWGGLQKNDVLFLVIKMYCIATHVSHGENSSATY